MSMPVGSHDGRDVKAVNVSRTASEGGSWKNNAEMSIGPLADEDNQSPIHGRDLGRVRRVDLRRMTNVDVVRIGVQHEANRGRSAGGKVVDAKSHGGAIGGSGLANGSVDGWQSQGHDETRLQVC